MKKYLAEFVRRTLILLLGAAVTVTPLFLQAQGAVSTAKLQIEAVAVPQNQQLSFSRANPLHSGKHYHKFLGTELKEKESEEDESDSSSSKRAKVQQLLAKFQSTRTPLNPGSTLQPQPGSAISNHSQSPELIIKYHVFRI